MQRSTVSTSKCLCLSTSICTLTASILACATSAGRLSSVADAAAQVTLCSTSKPRFRTSERPDCEALSIMGPTTRTTSTMAVISAPSVCPHLTWCKACNAPRPAAEASPVCSNIFNTARKLPNSSSNQAPHSKIFESVWKCSSICMTTCATLSAWGPRKAEPRCNSHKICKPLRCTSALSRRASIIITTYGQPPTSAKMAR
mmetsp:Transcript_166387/g.534465  ORF Transcript_166387/g.534465 Transcript_166387/m.534465 type:complete len:201 (-) Transcript_166387:873-1475(-)